MNILVTGGAGFIGSHFIKWILNDQNNVSVINLDKLTYAGNLQNLEKVSTHPRYRFIKGDICDQKLVEDIFSAGIDIVVNFAAETHVDRSIQSADQFIQTDMKGVYVLLEASKKFGVERFIQISTDEVYGSISEGFVDENAPLMASNPYSASKAGGDRLAYSYFKTFNVPVIITRTCNNYGPFQYPEKLIPLFVTNAIEGKPLPLYGDGLNRRDWIHAIDHCRAVWFLCQSGTPGEVYNVSGQCELSNIDITKQILSLMNLPESCIKPVKDRPGHDRRYAINDEKIRGLGWQSIYSFESGLKETIEWYQENKNWWEPIKSGEFKQYYQSQYSHS